MPGAPGAPGVPAAPSMPLVPLVPLTPQVLAVNRTSRFMVSESRGGLRLVAPGCSVSDGRGWGQHSGWDSGRPVVSAPGGGVADGGVADGGVADGGVADGGVADGGAVSMIPGEALFDGIGDGVGDQLLGGEGDAGQGGETVGAVVGLAVAEQTQCLEGFLEGGCGVVIQLGARRHWTCRL